jgi:hypothetical protein
MNSLENELDEGLKMQKYLTKNNDKLPLILQLQILQAFLEMNEKLKPIYVQALMMLGDKED